MSEEPRAYTAEEARDDFLAQIATMVRYWADLPDQTALEKCDGVAFSILNILDGTSSLPGFTVSLSPHPDDMEYHKQDGENWYEPGQVINDVMLHELWSKFSPHARAERRKRTG